MRQAGQVEGEAVVLVAVLSSFLRPLALEAVDAAVARQRARCACAARPLAPGERGQGVRDVVRDGGDGARDGAEEAVRRVECRGGIRGTPWTGCVLLLPAGEFELAGAGLEVLARGAGLEQLRPAVLTWESGCVDAGNAHAEQLCRVASLK